MAGVDAGVLLALWLLAVVVGAANIHRHVGRWWQ